MAKRILWCGKDTEEGKDSNKFHEVVLPEEVGPIRHLSAGTTHTFFINHEGKAYAFGNGEAEVLGVPTKHTDFNHIYCLEFPSDSSRSRSKKASPIVDIAAGDYFSLAVNSSGHLFTWGKLTAAHATPTRFKSYQDKHFFLVASGLNSGAAIATDNTLVFFIASFSYQSHRFESKAIALPSHIRPIKMVMSNHRAVILTDAGDVYKIMREEATVTYEDDTPYAKDIAGSDSSLYTLTGHPRWSPETHKLQPYLYQQIVHTVLLIARQTESGPAYPQSHIGYLPREILFIILTFASSYRPCELFMGITKRDMPIDDVAMIAAGRNHACILSGKGGVYIYADRYGAGGDPVDDAPRANWRENVFLAPQSLEGITVKQLYAGPYTTIALV